MKFSLNLARKKSLQPLIIMVLVISLPLLLSSNLGLAPFIDNFLPNLSDSEVKLFQIIFTALLIFIGLAIWKFGSKKSVLKVIIGYTIISTTELGLSLFTLVINLQNYSSSQALLLMKDGLVIWWMTALTFSLWYWLIDSGWAESMGMKDTIRSDFLFSQQSVDLKGWEDWTPNHIDYLYLGFNTNTAFSPADVMPLSHRAKLLMMTQTTLAIIIVGTVVARAASILI